MKSVFAYIFVLLLVGVGLAACREEPRIDELEGEIRAIIQGIESREVATVTDRLSEYFLANEKLDKDGVTRLLLANFLRKKKIEVIVASLATSINPVDPQRASASASVVLVGASQFIPDSGKSYNIESEWKIEGSNWRLVTINWK
jgi:hypothetical protein